MSKKLRIVREKGQEFEIKRVPGGTYPEGTVFFVDTKVPVSQTREQPTLEELKPTEPTLAELRAGERNIPFEGKMPELPPEAFLATGRERPRWLFWKRGNYTADLDAPED